MDVREKLVEFLEASPYLDVLGGLDYYKEAAKELIAHGVTGQECIPVTDVPWMGENIAKLCIRYMTEYADFHGYASQKKVKAHIIRLLQAEADGRIAIMPQPPKEE